MRLDGKETRHVGAAGEPRRVLFVDHARAMGGAETSLLILMKHFDPERYRPILATQEGVLMDRALDAGIEAHSIAMPRLKRSARAPFDLSLGSLALRRLAREQGCAMVHANVLRAAVYAAPAAKIAGLPLVWHVRDILSPGVTTKSLCRASKAVIAISQAVSRDLPCAASTHVIYNPIERSRATKLDRSALGLPLEGRLVATVGRLRRWKGHHRFIEVAASLAQAHPDLRFLVVGGRIFSEDDSDADYPDALRRLATEKGIAERVFFLGHRDDVDAIWPHLSALVHLGDAEPFGRVVAEAQMAGVPAIGFDEGGLPEIIAPGTTGYLVPKGDLGGVGGALSLVLDDPDRSKALSEQARRSAEHRFDVLGHAEAVQAVYDSLLPITSPGEY
jgi:glycosyltransferase involved in cell wall biosynthesis